MAVEIIQPGVANGYDASGNPIRNIKQGEVMSNGESIDYQEHLVSVDGQGGCVDERARVDGELRRGVKTLGGSIEFADMIFVAMHEAGVAVAELPGDFDVVKLVMGLYETDKAKELGLMAGVHNDDEHGHITDVGKLADRRQGCGHDKVRGDVLKETFGIVLAETDQHLVGRFVEVGAPIETYKGDHFGNARAIENHNVGKTLDTVAVVDAAPAFNHDIWAVLEIADEMAEALREYGYTDAAKLLTTENVADWSRRLYRGTLAALGGPADSVIELGQAA